MPMATSKPKIDAQDDETLVWTRSHCPDEEFYLDYLNLDNISLKKKILN